MSLMTRLQIAYVRIVAVPAVVAASLISPLLGVAVVALLATVVAR